MRLLLLFFFAGWRHRASMSFYRQAGDDLLFVFLRGEGLSISGRALKILLLDFSEMCVPFIMESGQDFAF